MKKLLFLFLLLSSFTAKAQEQFVNPVFNKTLYAYSRGSWNTLLSPSSITEYPLDSSVSDIYTQRHSCKLLENEFDHIKYDCNLCYQTFFEKEKTCSEKIVLFKILDDGKIQKLNFRPDKKDYYSREHFVVHQ